MITVDAATAARSSDVGVTIRATDRSGSEVAIPMRQGRTLPAMPDARVLEPLVPGGNGDEPILRTFSAPVSDLTAAGVDSSELSSLSIELTLPAGGTVYLDNVGLGRGEARRGRRRSRQRQVRPGRDGCVVRFLPTSSDHPRALSTCE